MRSGHLSLPIEFASTGVTLRPYGVPGKRSLTCGGLIVASIGRLMPALFDVLGDLSVAVREAEGFDAGLNCLHDIRRLATLSDFFTSSATTAKPFPFSSARAASIVAFSASNFVAGDVPDHGK